MTIYFKPYGYNSLFKFLSQIPYFPHDCVAFKQANWY